jgi:hypothetical protein
MIFSSARRCSDPHYCLDLFLRQLAATHLDIKIIEDEEEYADEHEI